MQNYFFIWLNGDYKKIFLADIIYVESHKNHIRIITVKAIYTLLTTMKRIEEILPKKQFCRIHRGYIVSIDQITSFNNYRVCLGGKQFPISESQRRVLLNRVTFIKGESKTGAGLPGKNSTDLLSLN